MTERLRLLKDPPALINYEAEMALLAALMARNELFWKATQILRPEHFADALHGRIFRAIERIVTSGAIANVLTLKAEFEQDPALQNEANTGYLIRVASSLVSILNIEDYCEVIRDLYLRRQLLRHADELAARAHALEKPADEVIAASIGDLYQMSKDGKQTASTKRAIVERLVESMGKPPLVYQTGIEILDAALGGGLYAGKLYAISARKKVGKTSFLTTISHNMNRLGIPHLFIALEMSPTELEQRNAAREAHVNPIAFLKGPSKELQRLTADYAVGMNNATVYESAPGASLDDVRRMVGRAVVHYGIKGVILDYWQLVSGKGKTESEEYHLRNVAQWFADAGRKLGIWSLLACQQNQDGNSRGGEGLRLAADIYLALNRTKGEAGAWLEMQESRYVPYQNIGSELNPMVWLHTAGLFFSDEPPAPRTSLLGD